MAELESACCTPAVQAFMGEYRSHLIALVEIARNARRADKSLAVDLSALDAGATALVKLLARYQRSGEFRADFDPRVMAMAIRAAIDGVPARSARDPKLDVEHCGRQLADLFCLATRKQPSQSRSRARGGLAGTAVGLIVSLNRQAQNR